MEANMPESFNKSKFKEMILFLSHKSQNDINFGAIKLNKLLFLSDFLAYGITGKAISNETYLHERLGPIPQDLVNSRAELFGEKAAKMRINAINDYKQERVIALRSFNKKLFSETEIGIMDQAIHELKDYSGMQASDLTHTWNNWLLTKSGEEIPYETVFIRQLAKISLEDLIWAKQLLPKES
jgi:uncharacterized phage-associated protein